MGLQPPDRADSTLLIVRFCRARLMAQLGGYESSVRDVKQALYLAHQVDLVIVQATIGVDYLPHPFSQFFTPRN